LYRLRTPPGVVEKHGFTVVHFSANEGVTRGQFFQIVQDIGRRYTGTFQQVDYAVDNAQGANRRLRLLSDEFETLERFVQAEDRALIPNDDGSGGSESLIVPGEGAVLPNYSVFEVWFRGANAGQLNPNVLNTSTVGASLPRFNANSLNRGRGLGANPLYSAPGVPWIFKAQDGSHDPLTYDDDGSCLVRISNALGIPLPPEPRSPDGDVAWVEAQMTLQGKKVFWIHPFDLTGMPLTPFLQQEDNPFRSESYITGKKGFRRLHKLTPQFFGLLPQNAVPILYDGESHAALACTVPSKQEPDSVYLDVVDGFFECFGFIVRPTLKNKVNVAALPWVDITTEGDLGKVFKLTADYRLDTVFDTEAETRYKWKENLRTGCLFFDFETVVDEHQHHTPYAVSWLMVDVDKNTGKPTHLNYNNFMEHAQVYVGADAADHLVKRILSCTWASGEDSFEYDHVLGVTFNGAGFDNHLLFEAFRRHNWSDITPSRWGEIKIDNEFMQGSQLVDFHVDTFFSLFDVRKHLVGSLDYNCSKKGFDTENKKLGDFNHAKVQAVYVKLREENGGDHAAAVAGLRTYSGWDLLPEGKTRDDYEHGPPLFLTHLTEYSKMDVASLGELFFRYREVANGLFDTGRFSVKPKMTLASESYAAFEKHIREKLNIPSTTSVKKNLKAMSKDDPGYEDYKEYVKGVVTHNEKFKILGLWTPMDPHLLDDIRKSSIVAGRVQLFHEPQWFKESVVSMDVKSLYPYVMAVKDVYYPIGDHERISGKSSEYYRTLYEADARLGLWLCDVDQSSLKARNLPVVLASKKPYDEEAVKVERNDWHAPRVSKMWITNEEIRILDKFNCPVTFYDCILWEEKMRSCDLFDVLTPLMKVKNKEDRKKDEGLPYNAALRTAAKLGSNSLYGKMMEDFHEWRTMRLDAKKYEEIVQIVESGEEDREFVAISVCYPVGPDVFARVKKNRFLKKHLHTQRPMVVGFYILAYARMYMYEYALAHLGLDKCYYMDTDCIKTSAAAFEERLKPFWSKTLVPHWPSCETDMDALYATEHLYEKKCRCYGGFENELKPDNNGLIAVAKKMWLVVYAPVSDFGFLVQHEYDPEPSMMYHRYPEDAFKCGMKGVQKSDSLVPELRYMEYFHTLNSTDPEWTENLAELYEGKKVRDNLLEVFASLLNGTTFFVKSNFVKELTQHSSRVRWGEEDKYVKDYGRISMRYSLVMVNPKKNQEVWPQEVRVEEA
jgi:hypothetical protein